MYILILNFSNQASIISFNSVFWKPNSNKTKALPSTINIDIPFKSS